MKQHFFFRFCTMLLGLQVLLLAACHLRAHESPKIMHHLIEFRQKGSLLYIDTVDNRYVLDMSKTNTSNHAFFHSFLIGLVDSTTGKAKDEKAKEKYFEYDLEKDFTALVTGDSIKPVFFQPKTLIGKMGKEGILVFETNEKAFPDTLVYRDSFGGWGTQIIIINQNH